MQEPQTERETAHLIEELGAAWRRHGPQSNQFHALMAEAIERADASDLLYQSCAALGGEEAGRLAMDMRRHVAEAAIVFSTAGGQEDCDTAVFAIPVVAPIAEMNQLMSNGAIMHAMRVGLARHRVFPPGSQVAFLQNFMWPATFARFHPMP